MKKKYIIIGLIIISILILIVKVWGHNNISKQLSTSHITQSLPSSPSYVFVKKWGSIGNEDGQFVNPRHIAIDKSDNIYTSDHNNGRIQKFDSEGNFILKWNIGVAVEGITIDFRGYVYAGGNYQIQKFDSQGNFILKWGNNGVGEGQFDQVSSIASDPNGYIYVIDNSVFFYKNPNELRGRIQKFDSNGNFIFQCKFLADLFNGIAIDPMGKIFLGFSEGRIYINKYKSLEDIYKDGYFKDTYWGKAEWTFPKRERGKIFKSRLNLATDKEGNLFALDISGCVYKIDSTGKILTKWGSSGSGDGEFNQPKAIAVDSKGNVYVMDTGNYRIQKFSPVP